MDLRSEGIQQFPDYRSICTCRRKHKLAGIKWRALHLVSKLQAAAVHQVLRHCLVIALRILLRKIFREDIMAGRGKSVAAHSSVVFLFICSLSVRCQSHNHISRAYVCVVYDVAALHAAGHSRINNDCTDKVTHICSLTACGIYSHTHFAKFREKFIRAVYYRADDFTRHKKLVAAYCR